MEVDDWEPGNGQPGEATAAATAAGDSRQLTLPEAVPGVAHLCIEYPGYVANEHKVLETLGGLDGLARQLQENPKALPLKFRPGDKNCHAAYGQREGGRRLLLKLTRPAAGAGAAAGQAAGQAGGGGGGEWQAEVVATLQQTYRFAQPADFQYIALDTRPVEEQGLEQQQDASLPGFQAQPLLCAPPLFAKQPQFDYGFRAYYGSQVPSNSGAAGTAAAGGAVKRRAGVMASFFDLEVPQPLPEAAVVAAARGHDDALRVLRALLQQRPVWPALALQDAFAEACHGSAAGGKSTIDELLPKLCYKFRNGPWKNAWTRRGFDPRSTPAARQWQCVEYHLPSEWYAKIAERKKRAAQAKEAAKATAQQQQGQQQQQQQQQLVGDDEPGAGEVAAGADEQGPGSGLPPLAAAYRQLASFQAVPATQSCSLQLGLLADSVVHETLEDPDSHAPHCTDTSGWLTTAAVDAIKRRIKERFQAVLDGCPILDGFEPPAAVLGVQQEQQQQPAEGQQQQQQLQQAEQQQQQGRRGRAGRGQAGKHGKQQQQVEAGAGAGQAPPGPEAMQLDGSPLAQLAPAGGAGMDVDGLAQQAQQQLRIRQGAAAAGGSPQQGPHILPTGLLASVADYLALLPEEDGEEEGEEEEEQEEEEEAEEEEGDGAHTDEGEGFQSDEGEGEGMDEAHH